MHTGRRYSLFQTLRWGQKYIFLFLVFDSIPVVLYYLYKWSWLAIPWEPIGVIGIAVAFYLGFKNNASYERLWEARKIWGGIVNTSRSITVAIRDFVSNDMSRNPQSSERLQAIRTTMVHRHVAWLHALTIQLRKLKNWEHKAGADHLFRDKAGMTHHNKKFEALKAYLSEEEYEYIMTKGNQSSHLLSLQSKHLADLEADGILEHFRRLQLQTLITELYTLQGKSERIKNYPFPRQYATVNYFFAVLFIFLLPFGMLSAFIESEVGCLIWMAIPFSVMGSWVFWTMEMIGDYSENPFEGLYNDVPITTMARGIEIDIRQMLDETDLPKPVQSIEGWPISM
ncbi:MAG: hypothetical protein MK212_15405 [Saprospiraceae bacterium]|nr:hypothetical protein [Saprospiraceae bacterium]